MVAYISNEVVCELTRPFLVNLGLYTFYKRLLPSAFFLYIFNLMCRQKINNDLSYLPIMFSTQSHNDFSEFLEVDH